MKDEIIKLLDFLDDQLDRREMDLLLHYLYALGIRNFNDYSQDEVNTIREIYSCWGDVLTSYMGFRNSVDDPVTLPFHVEEQ